MHQGIVWNNWRDGKIADDSLYRDLIHTRDPRAPLMLQSFENLQKRRRALDLREEIDRVQASVRQHQAPFRSHPKIDEWLKSFDAVNYGVASRFKILALVGATRAGKTTKAVSIFGETRTLKVGCGTCPYGVLPSLVQFDRSRHKAIVFDECKTDQILNNREFFQSSVYPQQMSQSACNQHAYELWVYMTAMIVCCNSLLMTVKDGLSASDADWMSGNVVVVELDPGEKWHM